MRVGGGMKEEGQRRDPACLCLLGGGCTETCRVLSLGDRGGRDTGTEKDGSGHAEG